MRVITLNANGIRAAARKGFFEWMEQQQPDFVCIQETKAQIGQLTDTIFYPEGYHHIYHDAEKKGYSGVALYSKTIPDDIQIGTGWPDFDSEGRYIQADFGNLSVISVYLPSGSSKEERQDFKYVILDRFLPFIRELADSGQEIILCGDINIAHQEIDLKNWKANQKNSGFLPEERAWMTKWLGDGKFFDAWRTLYPEEPGYTWWSNRGRAWDNNVGWRIDYQIITAGLKEQLQHGSVYREERFSDHAPLVIDYATTF